MAKKLKPAAKQDDNDTLVKAFFSGFFLPTKLVWRGLGWLAHRPPLQQIGHGLRWFFKLRVIRFIGRFLGLKYLRDSWLELRSVTWPTIRESLRLTSAVIIFSIVFGLFIMVIDYGLDKLFKQFLLK